MSDTLEYSYEEAPSHLTESEALDGYTKARLEHPDALVRLRDLDCGHWQVTIHETPAEKDALFRETFASMLRTFWTRLLLKSR
jgi:hypothetical protein